MNTAVTTHHSYPSLNCRTAIVTGGARGLGQVMARALVEQGANVVITGARDGQELAATAAALNGLGAGRCIDMMADVSDAASCDAVAKAAQEAFGSIDVLINNAARGPSEAQTEAGRQAHLEFVRAGLPMATGKKHNSTGDRFWEADVDGYIRMVMTNLCGPFMMSRVCAPGMIERGFGRIINISTSRPTMVHAGFGPYGPLKAALEASSRTWAAELDGTGVTVNVLLPGGAADTPAIPGGVPGTRAAPFKPGEQPRGQEASTRGLLPPAIMAAPLLWLASDESNGVTGRRFSARDWSDEITPGDAARHAEADRIDVPHII